ncbi:tripartite tricarboxylate transporter substrate-binding protein [Dankookia sp. P2]|uniref:tripartite tricarboxylate transporter substrate-binding protein n=1 Tax=Dankookia sp. P2 TaxID=3423955 RepID=UPI003D66AB8F
MARAGEMRLIGAFSLRRHPGFPEVPTAKEQGIEAVELSAAGLFAPRGTPEPVLARLESACQAAMATEGFRALTQRWAVLPDYLGRADFARRLAEHYADHAEVLRALACSPSSKETPMPRRIVDISVALKQGIKSDPPWALPQIDYHDHRMTAPPIAEYFGIRQDQLPEGNYAAREQARLSTHAGTHLDSPYHFFPRQDEALVPGGRPSMRIDEVPLDWCFQPGVKLDFRALPDGYTVQPEDVAKELDRIGHVLKPLEIVMVNTRAGSRYGEDDYIDVGCGMGKAATLYLLERGIRVCGTDAWSWDVPFSVTKQRLAEGASPDIIWEGHRAGREIGYCHMEKLHNLEALPADGFMVACFPVKVHRGSAGWTRAVAIFEE